MPTIIVEDGTGVANANSYVSEAELDSYSSDRGVVIPSTSTAKQQYLILAMDYLSSFDYQWKGKKTVDTNPLAWPRKEVSISGLLLADDEIPQALKNAQCLLVVEQTAGTLLFPKPVQSVIEGLVTQKTIGPITKKFAFNGKGTANSSRPVKIASVFCAIRDFLMYEFSTGTVRL